MIHKNWTDIIKPKRLEVDSESHSRVYGKFTCEPLERGFGTTLGNALRRVLLSSLRGSAITAVRIKDVHHEFSAIPGVREDVTEILLNLKQVRLRMLSDGVKILHLDAAGRKRGAWPAIFKRTGWWRSSIPTITLPRWPGTANSASK